MNDRMKPSLRRQPTNLGEMGVRSLICPFVFLTTRLVLYPISESNEWRFGAKEKIRDKRLSLNSLKRKMDRKR